MKHRAFMVSAVLLGGLLGVAPGRTQDKAALDGAALLQDRCARCHGIGEVESAKMDRKGWAQTIDRMIAKGARLNKKEREAVLNYLSGH